MNQVSKVKKKKKIDQSRAYFIIFLKDFSDSNCVHRNILNQHPPFFYHSLLIIYETLTELQKVSLDPGSNMEMKEMSDSQTKA